MFALGVSGYGGENGLGFMASMFHLFTHALFKALLFLGAGAVIHYIHSNEMNDMGGLRKKMPLIHLCFLIACLAIAGIPPFSGFFSKEEILLAAWHHDKIIFFAAIFTAMITAFYMFRLYFKIFWNTESNHAKHTNEAPNSMLFPVIVLAVFSIFSGLIPFGKFVSSDGKELITHLHLSFSIAPVLLALAGILLASLLYQKKNLTPQKVAIGLNSFYKLAYKKFLMDELYLFITKKIIFNLVAKPAAWIDKNIVDGGVNLTAKTTGVLSEKIKIIQSGKTQEYAIYFFSATIGLVLLFIYLWT